MTAPAIDVVELPPLVVELVAGPVTVIEVIKTASQLEVTTGSTTVIEVLYEPPAIVEVLTEQSPVFEFLFPGPRGPQGETGPQGPGTQFVAVAAENIPAFHAVALDSSGEAYLADRDTPADGVKVAGVSSNSALVGEDVEIVLEGVLTTPVSWPVGPVYLGDNGELVSAGSQGSFQLQVGVMITTTSLLVRPQFPIYL